MRKDFARGLVFGFSFVSLYQDFVYKTAEGYANYILNGGWTDRSITIPFAILALCIVFLTREP